MLVEGVKAVAAGMKPGTISVHNLHPSEKSIIVLLSKFPEIISESGSSMNPSGIAQYAYELAKEYNGFYQNLPVLKEPDATTRTLRLNISLFTAQILKSAFQLLGINMPKVM